MLLRECTDRRDLIVRALRSFRPATAEQLRLDPNREELRIETTIPRAHGVEMAVAELLFYIDVFVEHSLRRIDVHVDNDGAAMDGERVGGRGI